MFKENDMQATIHIFHDHALMQLDCRVAAMAYITRLLDTGTPFNVEYVAHEQIDAQPIREVQRDDMVALNL